MARIASREQLLERNGALRSAVLRPAATASLCQRSAAAVTSTGGTSAILSAGTGHGSCGDANGGTHGGWTPGAMHRSGADASRSHSARVAPPVHWLSRRSRRLLDDIYTSDHADSAPSGRFRWLFSTCLAAAVGVLAILVVIVGSMDHAEAEGGICRPRAPGRCPAGLLAPALGARRWTALGDPQDRPAADPQRRHGDQVRHPRSHPAAPRQPRLHHEQALCAAGRPAGARCPRPMHRRVPPFNPFKLYANTDAGR